VAKELLEAGALPPGARAVLVPAREASMFMVTSTARPESAGVAAARLQGAIRALAGRAPAAAALADARRRAARAFPLTLESHGQLLASWLAGDAAGLPAGHLASTPAALADADGAGALAAMGRDLTLLLAGPAARMRGRLATLGRVDTLRAEGETMVGPAGVEVTPEQAKRGRELVEAAIAAHGGAEKLRAAKVTYLDGDLRTSIGAQEVVGEARYLRIDPDRLAYTTRFLTFEHRQVLDRDRGWTLSMIGDSATLVPADSLSLQSLRGILESDVVHILRDAASAGDLVARGRETLDGRPVERIEFTNRFGVRTRLSLAEPGRRVVAVETVPTPQGMWRDRRRWSEYFQVEGIWWPRQEVRELDGERVSSLTIRRLQVNGEVDSSLFRRPIVVRGEIRGLE
jgi:hypothetical protein